MVRSAGDPNLSGIELSPPVDHPRQAAAPSGGIAPAAQTPVAFAADAVGINPALGSPGRALSAELPPGLFDSAGAEHIPDHVPPFRGGHDAEPLPAPHPPDTAPDEPQEPVPMPAPSPAPAEPMISTARSRELPPELTAALAEMESARLESMFAVIDAQLERHAQQMERRRQEQPKIDAREAAEAKALANRLMTQANLAADGLARAIEQTLNARRAAEQG